MLPPRNDNRADLTNSIPLRMTLPQKLSVRKDFVKLKQCRVPLASTTDLFMLLTNERVAKLYIAAVVRSSYHHLQKFCLYSHQWKHKPVESILTRWPQKACLFVIPVVWLNDLMWIFSWHLSPIFFLMRCLVHDEELFICLHDPLHNCLRLEQEATRNVPIFLRVVTSLRYLGN